MRFGVTVPCFGVGVDAALIADWAGCAERSGWDGFFLWDHMFAFAPGSVDVVDPWIALAAAACGTSRIRLGTLVTPLPRRRPLVVARQTVTLDRLSQGRLILGVGTGGGPYEWDYCGEETDPRVRGEMLDEHLDLLTRLWTGEPVHFDGTHYRVAGPGWSGICFPPPVQSPRIPVWVGGAWPGRRPSARAARWEGVAPIAASGAGRSATRSPSSSGYSGCATATGPSTSPYPVSVIPMTSGGANGTASSRRWAPPGGSKASTLGGTGGPRGRRGRSARCAPG